MKYDLNYIEKIAKIVKDNQSTRTNNPLDCWKSLPFNISFVTSLDLLPPYYHPGVSQLSGWSVV